MKFNWGKKKLTLVVIREANESVIRFRLRSIFLYLVPVVVLLAMASIYMLTKLYMDTMQLSRQLETEIATRDIQYDTVVSEKDRTIEQLMANVLELTNQTEQVQDKLNELQQIGDQIRTINGDSEAAIEPTSIIAAVDAEMDVMMASALTAPTSTERGDGFPSNPLSLDVNQHRGALSDPVILFDDLLFSSHERLDLMNGQGGAYQHVTIEEVLTLAEDTKANLKIIDARMADLKVDLEEAKELAIEYQHLLRITPSIRPTTSNRITSAFGYRRDPFTRRLSYHSGIDFGGKTGDPIYATAEGKVIEASYDRALGHHIMIDHTNGLRTVYAHLSKRLVSTGDFVEKGEQIGKLGSTGRSTGPHLHYEVYKNGVAVNPQTYLP